ncbi:MAG: cobalamin biosynthesis protein CobW [Betaproteobacteria bacterium]|nr:cobalamin biosynthesis protein CobW [Betaproteobacteria bacterium]
MSPALPALLIAGFGGPGRRLVTDALLRHKPADEAWALIAPAGLLGNARWPQGQAPASLWVETVAPGCPCCTGLTPFSAGLTALLRKLRDKSVTRLLIEGGSEGHIDSVARLLQGESFREHVRLAHALGVIDPAWLVNPAAPAQAALTELAQATDSLVAAPWNENAQARSDFTAFAKHFTPPRPWAPLAQAELAASFAQAVLSTSTLSSTA